MVTQEEYQRQLQEYQIQVALQRAMSAGRTAEGRLIPGATFSGREAHEQLMALGITDISQRKALIRKFTYGVYGEAVKPTAPYAGPVPLGADVEAFRKTGVTQVIESPIAGPVPEGYDVEAFRKTGITRPKSPVPDITKERAPPSMISPWKEPTVKERITEKYLFGKEQFRGAVFEMEKGAGAIIGGFGLLEYKPVKDISPFKPQIMEAPIGMGLGGTSLIRVPTKEEMTPEQKIEAESVKEQTKAYISLTGLQQKYQEKVSTGKLTLEQAEKEFEKESKIIQTKYSQKMKAAEKIYGAEVLKASLPLTFGKGVVFGGISALAPPVGLGLAGLGAGATVLKWAETKEQFRAYPGLSLAHFGVGLAGAGVGALGTGLVFRGARGYVRTFAKEPIAAEKLIRPSVLKGKELFPTAPTKAHLKIFKISKYKLPGEKRLGVWHATPKKFAKGFVVEAGKKRPRQPVGLYVAPEVSPYFLRTTATKYRFFGMGMESPLGKTPTILRIYPKGIVKGIKGRVGYAELPLTKREIQAVIPLSTQLEKMGSKYYTTWRGERIPIFQYEVLGKGKIDMGKGITFAKVSQKYYYKPSPTPIITPSSILYSLGVSKYYKPSKISYLGKPYDSFISYKKPFVSYKPSPYKPREYAPKKLYYPIYPRKPIQPYPPYKPPHLKTPFPFFPPSVKRIFDILERKKRKIPKAFRKIKQPFALTPSLPAALLGLRGPKPKYILEKPSLGVFPGIRFMPRKKRNI